MSSARSLKLLAKSKDLYFFKQNKFLIDAIYSKSAAVPN